MRMFILGGLVLLGVFSGYAGTKTTDLCQKPSPPDKPGKRPFIISTDAALDDWLAILYMLQHPQVHVKAIAVCGNGIAYAGSGMRITRGLVALGWPWNIPVACGAREPLKYNHTFPAQWRKLRKDPMGLSLPTNPFPPSTLPAHDLMIETIKKSPDNINILAIGPLTDLALAIAKEPAIIKKIEMIYIMGGAINVPGNVAIPGMTNIKNQCAEFNIYIDPVAADQVLKSGAPITLVPLDACMDVPLDFDFLKLSTEHRNTPQADFIARALLESINLVSSDGYYLWDPLTAVMATDESVIPKFEMMNIDVVTDNGPESGCTKKKPGKGTIRVCLAACKEKTWKKFVKIVNGR